MIYTYLVAFTFNTSDNSPARNGRHIARLIKKIKEDEDVTNIEAAINNKLRLHFNGKEEANHKFNVLINNLVLLKEEESPPKVERFEGGVREAE